MRHQFSRPLVALALAFATALPASAADIYWTNTAGGNWSRGANWNPNVIPGATDVALITASGSYTVTQDVSAVLAGLVLGNSVGAPKLTNGSRTLSISGLGLVRSNALFGMGGGSLSGGGTLVIDGLGVWTGGQVANTTGLRIGSYGILEITGPDLKVVYGGLTNEGRVYMAGEAALGLCAGVVENKGVFELENDQPIYQGGYCGPSLFVNTGWLRKSGGNGTNQLKGVPLANTGTLEARQGWISYNSGSIFGTGTLFNGAGTNLLDRGSVTIEGSIVSTNAELAGATLLGTNTIHGVMRWTGGGFGTSARTTIAGDAELEISGLDSKVLHGTLVNEGRVRLTGTAALGMCAGTVENSGVFDFENDQAIYLGSYCGGSIFRNTGLVRKTGGNGTNQFTSVPLVNTGTLEVKQGWIRYSSGSFFATGTQFLGLGTNLLGSGSVTFDGTIVSSNAELGGADLFGTNTIQGVLRWTGGNIDYTARVTNGALSQLEISGAAAKYLGGTLRNEGVVRLADIAALGMCSGTVDNAGVFELENDQAVYLGPYCGSSVFINSGVLRKSGGTATNRFASVPIVNSGVLEARSGWISYGSGSVFGTGTQFLGAGTNLLNVGSVWFNGPIVSSNAELGGADLFGTNTIQGVLRWTGGNIDYSARVTNGAFSQLEISGAAAKYLGGTLRNEGVVRLADIAALGMCSGTVDNAGVFELENDQAVYLGSYCGSSVFINSGVLRKSGGTATNRFASVPVVNSGVLEARSGWISYGSGSVFGTGTQFLGAGTNLLNVGSVWFIGAIVSSNAELAGAVAFGTNTMQGALRWTAGNFDHSSRVTIAPGSQMEISGTPQKILGGLLRNEGLIRLAGAGALGLCGGTLENLGTFELENDQPVYLNSYCGASSFKNAGLLRKSTGAGTNLFAGVPLANSGTVEARSGMLAFDAGFAQAAGCTRLAGGNLTSARTLEVNGGVVCGSGDIYASVNSSGELNPGQSIGGLTIHGNYVHSGTLNIELGGLTPGTSHDRLAITGSATLRGTLNVCLAPGYRPQEGNGFEVLAYASRTDSIRRFGGLDLGGGQYLTPVYGSSGLTLLTTRGVTNLYQMTVTPGGEGVYQLHYTCLPDKPYAIEASFNLTNDWIVLCTNTSPASVIDYLDVDAPNYPRRFYRVRLAE